MSRIRTYSELSRLDTFEERYRYLKLDGKVGRSTFGFDRYINQRFYHSREWRQVRDYVILRDQGCDLGVEGYEIHAALLIHHINPMDPLGMVHGDHSILDPEFLITTSHRTHNAIHYGDERQLARPFVERSPGDTKLW
jgi:hypothetical protein